jgi:hypothetical protein
MLIWHVQGPGSKPSITKEKRKKRIKRRFPPRLQKSPLIWMAEKERK